MSHTASTESMLTLTLYRYVKIDVSTTVVLLAAVFPVIILQYLFTIILFLEHYYVTIVCFCHQSEHTWSIRSSIIKPIRKIRAKPPVTVSCYCHQSERTSTFF